MTMGMDISGRNALVVGLARTGVATAKFLAGRGARTTVTELRAEDKVRDAVAEVRAAGIEVECGGHTSARFDVADLIVPSPGVPLDIPPLRKAKDAGKEIISELELAWRFLRGTTVAVTGSNGKTTTTALLGRIFESAGRATQVGGNIGTPLVSLVDSSTDDTVNLVEASSFQLEAVRHFRPRIGALLNITPDHLDRHASMAEYVAAKARLFGQQREEDFAIFNADDPASVELEPEVRAQRFWFSRQRKLDVGSFVDADWIRFTNGPVQEEVLRRSDIRLRGSHNLENVLAAVCAARLLDVPSEAIRDAVAGFEGVEHRLEFVVKAGGVKYFNDSKATNVDSALKAIDAFDGGLIVILGGRDKGGDFTALRESLTRRAKCALLIGEASEKIAGQIAGAVEVETCGTLEEAVRRAAENAQPGDVVLLAPGCASYDQFESYADRGAAFKREVVKHAMKKKPKQSKQSNSTEQRS